jgi:hypothetical protein
MASDIRRRLPCHDLRHCGAGRISGGIHEPPRRQIRGGLRPGNFLRQLGKPLTNCLEASERLTELMSVPSVSHGQLEHCLGRARDQQGTSRSAARRQELGRSGGNFVDLPSRNHDVNDKDVSAIAGQVRANLERRI